MRKPKSQSFLLLPLLPFEKNPRTLLPSEKKNPQQPKKQQKHNYKHNQEIKVETTRNKRSTMNPATNPIDKPTNQRT